MTPNYTIIFAILASLLPDAILAQLLSCKDVGCSAIGYGSATCNVDGKSLAAIGVSTFNTSLTSDLLLAWTVGYIREDLEQTVARRSYFLGTPNTLDLNSISSLTGCGVFFNGIGASLRFSQPGDSSAIPEAERSGSCQEALGPQCVADLLQQAENLTDKMWRNGTFSCSAFGQILQNAPPTTCTLDSNWGNVTTRDLTGAEAPSKIAIGSCNPTIANETSDLREVMTMPELFPHDYFDDITPILTAFVPSSDPSEGDIGPFLGLPENHLACMKPVAVSPPSQLLLGSASQKSLRWHFLASSVAASIGFALIDAATWISFG